MSEEVERRLVSLLGNPTHCPHGNPIPGLDELGVSADEEESGPLSVMTEIATPGGTPAVVRRISEQVQNDSDLMLLLKELNIRPGREVILATGEDGVRVTCDGEPDSTSELPRRLADHVFVSKR